MRVLLLVLVALASSPEEEKDTPALLEPFPFDHAEHAETFRKGGVGCVVCHPVGLWTRVDDVRVPPAETASAPRAVCHGCHREELPRVPGRAPSTCTSCHANREELIPDDHGVAWLDEHGPAARSPTAKCQDCHSTTTWCVACHDERGAMSRSPHGPAFGMLHGLEARLDPASCSTCHVGDSCTSCHATGSVPW